jgi:hypothetical protein
MSDPTLVIMAAGIGSRYGGLKQVDPVGPNDEIIIDYSVFDAQRAGFGKVVFIIRRDIEAIFRERVGRRIERQVDVAYVFQSGTDLPAGFELPAGRSKPWGTGHAVLCCREAVAEPMAVINADDFYGAGAFHTLAAFLRQTAAAPDSHDYALVGYVLANTLSEHGHVARGVCKVGEDGFLIDLNERLRIERWGEGIAYTENGSDWVPLAANSPVSMNMWGFAPSIFAQLAARFPLFLGQALATNPLKAEFLLPNIAGDMVREGAARVKVLPTDEHWFGVTYQEDRPRVQAAIRRLVELGRYPERLWEA